MKTKIKPLYYSFGGAICVGVLLMGASASAQNLLVSSYSGNVIDQITPGGTVSTYLSGLNYPFGMAFNSAGDLFVANSANDSGNGSILEVTPGGVQSTFYGGLDPKGLAFNSAGDLFESDYHSGNIYEYTPNGTQSLFASGFSAPQALAFNSAGDLFVAAGYGNNNAYITEITPSGTQSLFASGLNGTSGLAFNSAGDLFEADYGSGNIYEWTTDGTKSTYASVSGHPESIVFNGAGDLIVGVAVNNGSEDYVDEITPEGNQSVLASGIVEPSGLAIEPVPEPSTWALLATGAFGLLWRCRRENQKA